MGTDAQVKMQALKNLSRKNLTSRIQTNLIKVAAKKIEYLTHNGTKENFCNLYEYTAIRGISVEQAVLCALVTHEGIKTTLPHILKSLVYFDDAEEDPMPKLNFEASWEEIKTYFRHEVPKVAKTLLKL